MLIAFTSDLHLGITRESALVALAGEMRDARPDALVLGGDIAEGAWAFERALELLADVAPRRGYVPGNHDVWKCEGWSSRELLERRLPELAREHGYDPLEELTWTLGSTALVASMAWYDYSGIDPRFAGEGAAGIARRKAEFVNDADQIDWPFTDLDLAARLRGGVEQRLALAESDAAIERIVVATHVPVFDEQMTRRPGDARWAYSNAYFGHLTLGEVVRRFAKVTDVVSGHTHGERDAHVGREGLPPIRSRVCGSAYGRPRWVAIEV